MTDTAPRPTPPLGQTTRRVLVVLAAACVSTALLLTQADGTWPQIVFYAALVGWVVTVGRVYRDMQGLPQRPDRRLDERELALRNATYGQAYRVVATLGVAMLLLAIGLTEAIERGFLDVGRARALTLLLVGYVAVVLNLPWMALAWRLPDPVPETDA